MGLETKLGIGTAQFGLAYGISNTIGITSPKEVTSILKLAKQKNIFLIDTASAYGKSEEVLGKNNLEGFQIVSKFMPPLQNVSISDQLQKSLNLLNVDFLYGYLAHRPLDVLNNPGQWEELKEIKRKGLIKKIGFSLNEPSDLSDLLKQGMMPDLVQVPFNYLDRRFTPWLIKLKEKGCEVHTRSAFLQGLFFMNTDQLGEFFNEVKPIIASLQQTVNNLSNALLYFVVKQPFIDKVVIGVENEKQLIDNVENLDLAKSLPDLNITLPVNILMPSLWPKI